MTIKVITTSQPKEFTKKYSIITTQSACPLSDNDAI